jgi:hypothetical protein
MNGTLDQGPAIARQQLTCSDGGTDEQYDEGSDETYESDYEYTDVEASENGMTIVTARDASTNLPAEGDACSTNAEAKSAIPKPPGKLKTTGLVDDKDYDARSGVSPPFAISAVSTITTRTTNKHAAENREILHLEESSFPLIDCFMIQEWYDLVGRKFAGVLFVPSDFLQLVMEGRIHTLNNSLDRNCRRGDLEREEVDLLEYGWNETAWRRARERDFQSDRRKQLEKKKRWTICPICMSDDVVPPHDRLSMSCGHKFCRDCWTSYLQTILQNARAGAGGLLTRLSTCPPSRVLQFIGSEHVCIWPCRYNALVSWT